MAKAIMREHSMESVDSASITTEDSAAIVSPYNSWHDSDGACLSPLECDDDRLNYFDVTNHDQSQDEEPFTESLSILEQLKKRCREEDLPAKLKIRPRKGPNCLFLNYMAVSRVRMMQHHQPFSSLSEFDFSENDLFVDDSQTFSSRSASKLSNDTLQMFDLDFFP